MQHNEQLNHLFVAINSGVRRPSLSLMASFFLQMLVDRILPNRETQLLVALGFGLILVSTLQAGLQLGRRIHVSYGLRYIQHLLRLPMKVFDARCVVGPVMRINQANTIQLAITEGKSVL